MSRNTDQIYITLKVHATFLASDFFTMRAERSSLAFCSSARRLAVSPRPARFMKYVSIRMPDPGPFGETFFEARVRAIVAALFVNNPGGGWVESVLTVDTHLLPVRLGITLLHESFFAWRAPTAPAAKQEQ